MTGGEVPECGTPSRYPRCESVAPPRLLGCPVERQPDVVGGTLLKLTKNGKKEDDYYYTGTIEHKNAQRMSPAF